MKTFSKVAVACVLFFALAGNAWAAGPKDLNKSIRTLSGIRSVALIDDDDIPGVAAPASPISDSLTEGSDWDDVYSLHLNAGETLTLSLSGAAGTDFDIDLYAPGSNLIGDGDIVAYADDVVYPDTLEYVAATSGTYYIDTLTYDGAGSGAYTLTYSVAAASPIKNVYRFRNIDNGFYLWSADESEKATIIAELSDTWDYEGVAYKINTASADNQSPLWRFLNLNGGFYLYSADASEKDTIVATLADQWRLEGTAYKVSRKSVGTRPVWRFRNNYNGTYLLSADPAERDTIVATLSDEWKLEGPAFFIAP